MKFEIKARDTGKVLFSLATKTLKLCLEAAVNRGADLRSAYLRGAFLRGAFLGCADLRGADLRGAFLRCADLRSADLRGAHLRGADLRGADLEGAKGINYFLCTPLSILKDQVGKIRAYKLVKENYSGTYYPSLTYKIGEHVSVKNASKDENEQCAEGINLATLDWCIKEWKEGYKILVAEFASKDIAAIPIATDGKFRVRKCKIIREKNLKILGLE